jgi:phosphoenolpyruvate synthase/pyruvate phosphate dikinase
MDRYVLGFQEIDRTRVMLVGGKGAHLGELARIEGIRVPPGFCVTTDAFRQIVLGSASINERIEELSRLTLNDADAIRTLSKELRAFVESTLIPDDIAAAITSALMPLGEDAAYAVRSSATAEDLPTASFAGQHDTFLNVVGRGAIIEHVRKCWASLFTERAVTYRVRNGFDHRAVYMAVIIQRMVVPQASGILFTADPVTGIRKVASVEAVSGLGEALVSGLVNPDVFKVRDDEIIAKSLATSRQALEDPQVLQLVATGRRIEKHFGSPQDIEWCFADGAFQFVQSRAITTLFPVPESGDGKNHVYISVGHQQMMTDAMKPLGLSFWQMTTPRPMSEAGGRLFVDVTNILASSASREAFVKGFTEKSDPLIGDALQKLLDRGDFIDSDGTLTAPHVFGAAPSAIETDPGIPAELIARTEASLAALERNISSKSGTALLDFILEDIQELRRILFDPRSREVIMAGMEAVWWLNDHLQEWLGEKNAADTLAQSAPNNVTSEMGLALLDVADVIRAQPGVVVFLQRTEDDEFMRELPSVAGGTEARDAIQRWLDKYGVRGVGEIDITRPRWSENPRTLLPLILGNVRNFATGEGARRFEQGRQEALKKEQELLSRLRKLPEGAQKAEDAKRMIDRVWAFVGYREYPKYGMVRRYFMYKQALLEEAERLVQASVFHERDDVFYLRFDELRDVVRTHEVSDQLIRERRAAFTSYQALTPPRVLTSDGEVVTGSYRREAVPENALVGFPVSAGTVEGRARVVLELADVELEPGDILVTVFTDPSWTPLFVSIKGLVTEVGGLMTHGAVIAREYGLPAVVGVQDATQLIRNGQRIRVNGTEGYVEILD